MREGGSGADRLFLCNLSAAFPVLRRGLIPSLPLSSTGAESADSNSRNEKKNIVFFACWATGWKECDVFRYDWNRWSGNGGCKRFPFCSRKIIILMRKKNEERGSSAYCQVYYYYYYQALALSSGVVLWMPLFSFCIFPISVFVLFLFRLFVCFIF